MLKKNEFILQTAKDYDMSYREVEKIYKLYQKDFYEKLEEFIEERRKQDAK